MDVGDTAGRSDDCALGVPQSDLHRQQPGCLSAQLGHVDVDFPGNRGACGDIHLDSGVEDEESQPQRRPAHPN
ncbi:hypothetical protein [Frankia sp. CiP3]|uniref:hypothetical protein n=1 Tax=Frankia sp. CiP3 TaxID=2880971 RepID=UPI0035B0D0BD